MQDQTNRWDRFDRLLRFLEHAMRLTPRCTWVLEWPKSSSMWRLDVVQTFLSSHAHHAGLYASCAWQQSLTRPSGAVRRIATNDRSLALQLSSTCSRSHEHSVSSQFQPLQVEGFLRAALLIRTRACHGPACLLRSASSLLVRVRDAVGRCRHPATVASPARECGRCRLIVSRPRAARCCRPLVYG